MNNEWYNNPVKPNFSVITTLYYMSWKDQGKQNKGNQKMQVLTELDSLQYSFILWFFSIYTNPPTFEVRMLKSHLPMQHTASAKLKLSKSHLSSASENQMCPYTTQTKAWVRGLNTWNGVSEPSLLLLVLEKVHDNSHPDFGKYVTVQHWVSFRWRALTRIPKACYCNSGPT